MNDDGSPLSMKGYIDDVMKNHELLDDLRFKAVNEGLGDLKSLVKAAVLGIVGAVGLALLNLVLKH
jgi:hypothetical protein